MKHQNLIDAGLSPKEIAEIEAIMETDEFDEKSDNSLTWLLLTVVVFICFVMPLILGR